VLSFPAIQLNLKYTLSVVLGLGGDGTPVGLPPPMRSRLAESVRKKSRPASRMKKLKHMTTDNYCVGHWLPSGVLKGDRNSHNDQTRPADPEILQQPGEPWHARTQS
jgi:hypothetical protein